MSRCFPLKVTVSPIKCPCVLSKMRHCFGNTRAYGWLKRDSIFVKTVFAILLGRERNHVFTVSMCLPGFAFTPSRSFNLLIISVILWKIHPSRMFHTANCIVNDNLSGEPQITQIVRIYTDFKVSVHVELVETSHVVHEEVLHETLRLRSGWQIHLWSSRLIRVHQWFKFPFISPTNHLSQ